MSITTSVKKATRKVTAVITGEEPQVDLLDTLHEIEASIDIQNEGFENLIRGSQVAMDELLQKAPYNWYIEAQQAKSLGLVRDVL